MGGEGAHGAPEYMGGKGGGQGGDKCTGAGRALRIDTPMLGHLADVSGEVQGSDAWWPPLTRSTYRKPPVL